MTVSILFRAFLRRDLQIATSYRASFILELASIVFFLALFFYLSRLVDDSEFAASQDVGGDYFAYVAVGMFVFQIVQVSVASFTRKIREEQTTGTFEALMATPVNPALIVFASATYDLLRATVSGLILLGAAVAVFGVHLEIEPGTLAVGMLALVGCLALFASLGILVGAATVLLKRAAVLVGLMLTGLSLLGGVYFPVDLLPGLLEFIAEVLPFTWGVDLLRASLLGGDVDPLQLVGLFASVAVLLPVSLMGFGAAVRRARRMGTLADY
jgi:ABC-2 type transport system permease protein